MDTIEFRIARSKHARRGVSILINGMDLIKLVREFETPMANREGIPGIAGSYAPISKNWFKRDHAEALNGTHYKPKLSLYCCKDCGEVGCWPLDVKITIQGNQVTWSEFEQPHREGKWDYATLGPFCFDSDKYRKALVGASTVLGMATDQHFSIRRSDDPGRGIGQRTRVLCSALTSHSRLAAGRSSQWLHWAGPAICTRR